MPMLEIELDIDRGTPINSDQAQSILLKAFVSFFANAEREILMDLEDWEDALEYHMRDCNPLAINIS